MKNIDKKLVDKYFSNDCTKEEADMVLEWFDTPEGKKYLEEKIESDMNQMDEENEDDSLQLLARLDSEKLLASIYRKIELIGIKHQPSYNYFSLFLKSAAVVLVVLTASIFYFSVQPQQVSDLAALEAEPIIYSTQDDQQKRISLGDGSTVELNSNSVLMIKPSQRGDDREVFLAGEAFFDISHDPDRAFAVHTDEAVIEVLGTAFNVRSFTEENNVQVAVRDGKVAFSRSVHQDDRQPQIIDQGNYAILDLENNVMTLEDYGVENYLAWMNGRMTFDELPLGKVCLQLERIYRVDCRFEDSAFEDMKITADFSEVSLEKTLSVISLSLNLDYKQENDTIIWVD